MNCSGSEERLADCDHDGVDLGDTVGCERAYVRCLHKIMVTTGKKTGHCLEVLHCVYATTMATTENASTSVDINAVIIGSSVGGVFLLLVVVALIVTVVLIVVRQQTVRYVCGVCAI